MDYAINMKLSSGSSVINEMEKKHMTVNTDFPLNIQHINTSIHASSYCFDTVGYVTGGASTSVYKICAIYTQKFYSGTSGESEPNGYRLNKGLSGKLEMRRKA